MASTRRLPIRGVNTVINILQKGKEVYPPLAEPESATFTPRFESTTRAPIDRDGKEITDPRIVGHDISFEGTKVDAQLSVLIDAIERAHEGGDQLLPKDLSIQRTIYNPNPGERTEKQLYAGLAIASYEDATPSLTENVGESISFTAQSREVTLI